MKRSIALDFDDTMTRFFEVKLAVIKRELGIGLDPRFLKKTAIQKSGSGITPAQYEAIQRIVWGDAAYTGQAKPEESMVDCVQAWCAAGIRVSVVTSRTGEMLEWAEEWLAAYGLNLEVIGVGYGKTKRQAVLSVGAEVFVDDDWPKLEDLQGVVEELVLFDRPFNADEILPPGVFRAASWRWLHDRYAR